MKRKYRPGMVLKSRDTGRLITIKRRASGNRHWTVDTTGRKSHHIHEGTMDKFYEVVDNETQDR